jgi:hypothetical protein
VVIDRVIVVGCACSWKRNDFERRG